MDIRKSKDLHKLELHNLFAYLKAYEFELQTRDCEPSVPKITNYLSVVKIYQPFATETSAEKLSNDAMSLFIRKNSAIL